MLPCQRFRQEIGTDCDYRNLILPVIKSIQSSSHRASSYTLNADGTAKLKDTKKTTSCGTDGKCLRGLRNVECNYPDVECYGFNFNWPTIAKPALPCNLKNSDGSRVTTTCAWKDIITNVNGQNLPNNTILLNFYGTNKFVIHEDESIYIKLSNSTLFRSDVEYAWSTSLAITNQLPELTLQSGYQSLGSEILNATQLPSEAISFPQCQPTSQTLCNTRLYLTVKYDSRPTRTRRISSTASRPPMPSAISWTTRPAPRLTGLSGAPASIQTMK